MPRLAANLTMLWQELDPYDRFRAAAAAGFTRVEMLFPQALDPSRLEVLLQQLGLEMVLFDPIAGDWAKGDRGIVCIPGREAEFMATVREAVTLAHRLGTRRLNALIGIPPASTPDTIAEAKAIDNLKQAAELTGAAGIELLVENINNVDAPGYWAGTAARAASLVERIAHPMVRLQLDQYHAGMAGEDALACYERWRPLISHVQVADIPGRHEPGTGTQPIASFLAELDRSGYGGYVGLEYKPLGSTDEGLAWAQGMLGPQ
jgi:hydroxypyruvate isomerase